MEIPKFQVPARTKGFEGIIWEGMNALHDARPDETKPRNWAKPQPQKNITQPADHFFFIGILEFWNI